MHLSRRTALVVLVVLAGCRRRSLPHEGKSAAELEAMLHDADPAVRPQGAFGLSLLGPQALSGTAAGAAAAQPASPRPAQCGASPGQDRSGSAGGGSRSYRDLLRSAMDGPPTCLLRTRRNETGSARGPAIAAALSGDPDPLVRKAAAAAIAKIRAAP
jgi:hypothetical protein